MGKRHLAASAIIAFSITPNPLQAQSVMEGLPDYLQRRIDADRANSSLEKLVDLGLVQNGIVTAAKRWPTTNPVKVCFFGGSNNLRMRIVSIANQWAANSPLSFDWGSAANPRLCGSEFSHIRVGYSPTGYWSLIGQDSIVHAGQLEQSLNLGMFDFNPPPEVEFRATVLHEFGHALGFQHEHQHPHSSCESEFNWPAIYNYLAGPPNYWNQAKVDHNMRRRPYYQGDVATNFDRDSIMLYTFPSQFYLRGTSSICYTAMNNNLSNGDRQTFAAVYGNRDSQLAALEEAAKSLSPSSRALVADRLSLFRLSNVAKAQVVARTELEQATPTFGRAIGELEARTPQ